MKMKFGVQMGMNLQIFAGEEVTPSTTQEASSGYSKPKNVNSTLCSPSKQSGELVAEGRTVVV